MSTLRSTPTTRQRVTSDSSAVGAVRPAPTSNTLCMGDPGDDERFETIVRAAANAAAEDLGGLQPAGWDSDHRLRPDARGQNAHVAGMRRLLGPDRHLPRLERGAI